MPTLHQFVPTLDPGAVGGHTLEIQRTLREAGWESEVFSEHTRGPYEGLAHRFTEYGRSVPAHDTDVVVYHAAIGSVVADWLMARRPARLVVDYHNITPPVWFERWEPALAYGLGWGRAQLRRLGRRARFGLADSAFNAAELEAVGFRRPTVLPILLPPGSLDAAPANGLAAPMPGPPGPVLGAAGPARAEGGARWLFVGRIAPNKGQHLLVAALAVARRTYDARTCLVLVGGASSATYADAVRRYADDLGVADAVTMTGAVSDGERNAHYETADVFTCLSSHEGFCVPLLEAWHHRLPIVAHAAAAVPETLGDAGIGLPTTSPLTMAAAAARVVSDPLVAGALAAAGTARLSEFSLERTRARLMELAEALASGLADRRGPSHLSGGRADGRPRPEPAPASSPAVTPSPAVAPGSAVAPSPAVAP